MLVPFSFSPFRFRNCERGDGPKCILIPHVPELQVIRGKQNNESAVQMRFVFRTIKKLRNVENEISSLNFIFQIPHREIAHSRPFGSI